jgi:hypothetical protein
MIERQDRVDFVEQLRARRRRGRPRRSVPTIVTSVKLPEDVYDALCRLAISDRESLHGLMKQALTSYARSRPADFR